MNDLNLTTQDYQKILEASPDLYLILDKNFNIIEASNAYLVATMVKKTDILGKGIFEVFPDNPEDPHATGVANLKASLNRVLQYKKSDAMAVQKHDIRRAAEHGSQFEERYWSPINTPVLDNNNEVKYIIHRVKDVTEFIHLKAEKKEQKKITQHLLEKNEIMGIEIYHRAQELQKTNEQLRIEHKKAEQWAKQAEKDSQSKSIFFAMMSHEIRTALNGVIGMTELLLDSSLATHQLEYLEIIHTSGTTLLKVINEILDYSKIDSGHMQLENIEFEIQATIDEAIEIVIGQAYRKRIDIGTYIEPNVPSWLYGDPARIRQILNNLICNAIKFTKHGEIKIWVKLLEKRDNEVILLFQVSDTGVGISKDAVGHLFQPFVQEKASTARTYGGTGLGLYISKQLVELMHGEIGIKSELGKGSEFSFTLHLQEIPHAPTFSFKKLPEFKHARLLCLDDSVLIRDIMQRLIHSWGIRCDTVENTAEFISMLIEAYKQQDPYTLAFIDDCTPECDNIELIKTIQKINETAKTSIVLLLSFGVPVDEDKLNLLNLTTLAKPINPKKLYTTIVNSMLEKIPKHKSGIFTDKNTVFLNTQLLLAEDNFVNQQICLAILRKFGLTADVAKSGVDAVSLYKNYKYDLILMDCQMPDMDGYAATKAIRKIEEKSGIHTPIIAMTAYALKGDKEKCTQAGMDDYIPKPIIPMELLQLLEKWLIHRKIKA